MKMQLHPHFLFNTLNTIYNLIPVNAREAQGMITRLSNLLRFSLDHVATETVTLHDELDFLMEYVQIEKTRFEERLRVEKDVPTDTLQAEVPNMILQPLVENAIRIGKKAAGGTMKISTRRENGREIVESIDAVHSVDLVADPATVSGLHEGRTMARRKVRDLIECLCKTRPGYARGLKEEAEAGEEAAEEAAEGEGEPAEESKPAE